MEDTNCVIETKQADEEGYSDSNEDDGDDLDESMVRKAIPKTLVSGTEGCIGHTQ